MKIETMFNAALAPVASTINSTLYATYAFCAAALNAIPNEVGSSKAQSESYTVGPNKNGKYCQVEAPEGFSLEYIPSSKKSEYNYFFFNKRETSDSAYLVVLNQVEQFDFGGFPSPIAPVFKELIQQFFPGKQMRNTGVKSSKIDQFYFQSYAPVEIDGKTKEVGAYAFQLGEYLFVICATGNDFDGMIENLSQVAENILVTV